MDKITNSLLAHIIRSKTFDLHRSSQTYVNGTIQMNKLNEIHISRPL